jgi:hypothetical protein
VDGVNVLPNGTPPDPCGSLRVGTLHLTIPRRDSSVSVIAYNGNGAGEPATVKVKWSGPGTDPELTLYVLAIGISNYKDQKVRLRFPAKDAADFVKLARAQEGTSIVPKSGKPDFGGAPQFPVFPAEQGTHVLYNVLIYHAIKPRGTPKRGNSGAFLKIRC